MKHVNVIVDNYIKNTITNTRLIITNQIINNTSLFESNLYNMLKKYIPNNVIYSPIKQSNYNYIYKNKQKIYDIKPNNISINNNDFHDEGFDI